MRLFYFKEKPATLLRHGNKKIKKHMFQWKKFVSKENFTLVEVIKAFMKMKENGEHAVRAISPKKTVLPRLGLGLGLGLGLELGFGWFSSGAIVLESGKIYARWWALGWWVAGVSISLWKKKQIIQRERPTGKSLESSWVVFKTTFINKGPNVHYINYLKCDSLSLTRISCNYCKLPFLSFF